MLARAPAIAIILFMFASSSQAMDINRRKFMQGAAAIALTKGRVKVLPAAPEAVAVPAFSAEVLAGRMALVRSRFPEILLWGNTADGQLEAATTAEEARTIYSRIIAKASLEAGADLKLPLEQVDEEVDDLLDMLHQMFGFPSNKGDRNFVSIKDKFVPAVLEKLESTIPNVTELLRVNYGLPMKGIYKPMMPLRNVIDHNKLNSSVRQSIRDYRRQSEMISSQAPSLQASRERIVRMIQSRCEQSLNAPGGDPSASPQDDRGAQDN